MDLTRKQKTTTYICVCALLLAAELLQNVAGLLPEIFGARCLLIIPALMILAVGEEEIAAGLLGLFAGLLWDLSSAVHMGFNCIFFALVCFFAAALVNHLLRNTFITNMLICIAVTVLYCLTYWLCFIVIKGTGGATETLFGFYFPGAVYTIAVSPLAFVILKPIKYKLNNIKK